MQEKLEEVLETLKDAHKCTKQIKLGLTSVDMSKGLDLLTLKNLLLLQYEANLLHVINLRLSQRHIVGEPVIRRLVQIRTVLEKLKPIEYKMKYQIDKLIKFAVTGQADDDKLSHRPNVQNMGVDDALNEDDADSGGEDDEALVNRMSSGGKYLPPKLVAMPYSGDDDVSDKMKSHKRAALRRDWLEDLQAQYSHAPEEMRDIDDTRMRKEIQREREKEAYEEEFMTRLQPTKMDRKDRTMSRRAAANSGSLDAVLGFGRGRPQQRRSVSRSRGGKFGKQHRKMSKSGKPKKSSRR